MKVNEDRFIVPTPPNVSVIIPTYNRKGLLHETLYSLTQQTYPNDHFDVIVVDDGSTDGTAEIANESFPFAFRYFWQSNQGDAAARNLGAAQSQAEVLVFLDDDILVEADYLSHLVQAYEKAQNKIVIGTCNLTDTTPFSESLNVLKTMDQVQTITEVPFRDAYSNNMSLSREAYFNIGMMQGLDFPGSSMWCDLDFNYRAYQKGFKFFRSSEAICWHRDYTVRNLDTYTKRMRTAGYRAVVLFQKHPDLIDYIPMFSDKTPIIWGQDSLRLIARKLARVVASSPFALWSMKQIVHALEMRYPMSTHLSSLYRYIIGGYLFQGYREGLHKFKLVGTQK